MTTSQITIDSFNGSTAVLSYGDGYKVKEIVVPEEFIGVAGLDEPAFLHYASGFTPELIEQPIPIGEISVFVGSNPKQQLLDSLNRIGHFKIITDHNVWADNIIYDWDQNEEMVRYVEQHNMLYDMTRFLLHNKWVLNEAIRLINLDFTMTMSRDVMKSPFPKIVFPKKQADLDYFFGAMPKVIVKPFYGLQDDSRVFDRKMYVSQTDFETDIIAHYGSMAEFFAKQFPEDFVWDETVKHDTPIMLQEWFDDSTSISSTTKLIAGFNPKYITEPQNESVRLAIDNFLVRSGTLKPALLTIKCITDSSGFSYIIDLSFAINNFLDMSNGELDSLIKNVVINRSSTQ